MKKNCWSLFGMLVATSVMAQTATNPPAAPAIETPAPAAMATNTSPATTNAPTHKKKAAPKKKPQPKPAAAEELRTVPLVSGPATVVANHVNVRAQGKLKSEVIGRLNKGDQVTVAEEVVHNNSGANEPSAWAKILLPTNTHAYVSTSFIDPSNQTVRPKRLNVRSGPGENYTILVRLDHGAPVKPIGTKGDWTEIEAPTNAFAFVASQYLKQEAPGTTPTPAPTEPTPTPTTVAAAPTIAPAPTETPTPAPTTTTPPTETPAVTNAATEIPSVTNATAETTEPPTPATEEPPPKRIVQREGMVRATFSIQAPTKFQLYSPDNGRTIDYLYTSSPNLDLRRYKGLRIVVTGEEALEERWGNVPVITIQKIQVMDESP